MECKSPNLSRFPGNTTETNITFPAVLLDPWPFVFAGTFALKIDFENPIIITTGRIQDLKFFV
jgi:hypothetical protein